MSPRLAPSLPSPSPFPIYCPEMGLRKTVTPTSPARIVRRKKAKEYTDLKGEAKEERKENTKMENGIRWRIIVGELN